MNKKVGIPMRVSTLLYSIKQGMKNIRRNRMFSLASIGTIMACLFLFGIFFFVLSNFRHIIKTAETSVGITVFFEEDIAREQIEEIGNDIVSREEVEEINFVSAEEAWEKFKNTYYGEVEDLMIGFDDDNPLENSASYEVYLNDVSKQDTLVEYVKGMNGVRQVNSSDIAAKGLSSFNILVGYVSAAIIMILLAVAIFLISTTVTMGISVRREEISIMQLIGATDFFIRAPFIVEGIIIGLIGAILPLVLLYFIYNKIVMFITLKFNILSGILTFIDVKVIFLSLVPISIGIGVGIGFFGSFITVKKYLKR